MKHPLHSTVPGSRSRRSLCTWCAIFALALPLPFVAGCSEEVQAEFRAAALESIGTGLSAIAEGVIAGLVSIATPEDVAATGETSGA
ncbi:MAG: hypothetical protein AB1716_19125 [Planctomycetota bacterium]